MKRYGLSVRGNSKSWGFDIWATEEQVKAWRADGLVVGEIVGEETGILDDGRDIADLFGEETWTEPN